MRLLQELLEAKQRKPQKPKTRNFVAKNVPQQGAGEHNPKKGQQASRERQKREWKRERKMHEFI